MQTKAELETVGSLQSRSIRRDIHPRIVKILTYKRRTEKGFFVEVDARKFVALSTELTHELVLEGLARELVKQDPKYAEGC